MTTFQNIYEDADYADSYAGLEWVGTYHLVRRDLPSILRKHITGRRALDFGCGTGRSTRLLRECGFNVTGVDVAESMILRARQLDPEGDYRLCKEGGLARLPRRAFDLTLAAFPFDNTPAHDKPRLLRTLRSLLRPTGRIVNVVSSSEIYKHEWASFSSRDFPENRHARDGEIVRLVTTEFRNRRPCEDVLCTDEAYRGIYADAGLEEVAAYRPLARGDEGVPWVSETQVAPWVIWVLKRKE
ncbi:MAG: methyltransferase domain-containing protein [Gemmatimonadales bacterium]|nr:methyltransferase domain-containing protein [Gemmatimonadales bacterium]